jgi:hypothetical protein
MKDTIDYALHELHEKADKMELQLEVLSKIIGEEGARLDNEPWVERTFCLKIISNFVDCPAGDAPGPSWSAYVLDRYFRGKWNRVTTIVEQAELINYELVEFLRRWYCKGTEMRIEIQ